MFDQTPEGLLPDEIRMMSRQTPQQDVLQELVQKMLEQREPTDIELQQLSDVQLAMFMKIKERKNVAAKKRPDELQKMFFKRALKYAEDMFMKKRKTKRINMFYRHHFQEIAKKLDICITTFYHPNRQTKTGVKSGCKTFNFTYVRLVLRSDSFRQVVKNYLNVFLRDNLKERKKKVTKLIEACYKVIEKNAKFQEQIPQKRVSNLNLSMFNDIGLSILDEQSHYRMEEQPPENKRYAKSRQQWDELDQYLQSSKCKIPWSNSQLEEAKKMAQIQIQEIERDSG